MVLLLVVAPVGYSLFSRDDGGSGDAVSEFGVDFVRSGGLWKTELGGGVFGFQYLPSEVVNVSVSGIYDFEGYVNEILYFVDANEGASEVLNNFGGYILRYQDACVDNSSCVGDFPLKGCDSNLIIFEEGNESMVWRNESCVYIVGDGVRGADAFLYKTLKIS
jgi:hypothetical protein